MMIVIFKIDIKENRTMRVNVICEIFPYYIIDLILICSFNHFFFFFVNFICLY